MMRETASSSCYDLDCAPPLVPVPPTGVLEREMRMQRGMSSCCRLKGQSVDRGVCVSPTIVGPLTLRLLLCLLCWASCTPVLHAQTYVVVSVKHILEPNGTRSIGFYSSDTAIEDVFTTANTILQTTARAGNSF